MIHQRLTTRPAVMSWRILYREHRVTEWWKEQGCQQRCSNQFHIWCYFNSQVIIEAMLWLMFPLFLSSVLVKSDLPGVGLFLPLNILIISKRSFLTLFQVLAWKEGYPLLWYFLPLSSRLQVCVYYLNAFLKKGRFAFLRNGFSLEILWFLRSGKVTEEIETLVKR